MLGFRAIARLNAAIWPDATAVTWQHRDAEWLHVPDCPPDDDTGADVSVDIVQNEFAWYWIDEPGGGKWDGIYIPCSKLLKQIDPDMLVWADPTSPITGEQLEAALPYVDMLCPSLGHITGREGAELFHRTRLPSWMYVCASEKNGSPFGYHRWFSWKTFSYGLRGIGMWVHTDRNALTLSDYVTGVGYAMAFGAEQAMIGSKRWDSWRQGIADYE